MSGIWRLQSYISNLMTDMNPVSRPSIGMYLQSPPQRYIGSDRLWDGQGLAHRALFHGLRSVDTLRLRLGTNSQFRYGP
jgi:hypothetical protein